MDEAHEGGQGFLAPQGDTAESFEEVEGILDQPSLGMERSIKRTGARARGVRRDLRLRPKLVPDENPEMIGVIGSVRDHVGHACEPSDQARGLGRVAPLPGRWSNPERQAERVCARVQLGGQPAARPSDPLKASPPFAPVASAWTLQIVESTKTYSKSGAPAKALKRRSQTPARAHLRNRA